MSSCPEYTWGHTIPFGLEYYQKAKASLLELRADIGMISEISSRAVKTIRAGNKVYMNVTTGHMPTYELVNEREGNPALFEFSGSDACTPEQFAAMEPGDLLLTNNVGEDVKNARQRGVYVVIFTTCYVNNKRTPPGRVNPNVNDWMPEDIASEVVYTSIPWQQGLVNIPEIPYMEAFPGSANVSCAIHWMITAETARSLATGGMPDGSQGLEYLDILLSRVDKVFELEMERINETALTLARRFIDGGRFFVRSRNEGIQSEVSHVAQGLMIANLFEPRSREDGGDKDVMLIAMVSAGDPAEIQWAEDARNSGSLVVGIGPGDNPQMESLCDVYFYNRCDEAEGIVKSTGHEAGICPATGIINNILTQALQAQFVDEMCRRGEVPYFYMGGYRTGGGAFNEMMRPLAEARGY